MLEIRPSLLQVYLKWIFLCIYHYAEETVLEDLYRVMASDPFNTG